MSKWGGQPLKSDDFIDPWLIEIRYGKDLSWWIIYYSLLSVRTFLFFYVATFECVKWRSMQLAPLGEYFEVEISLDLVLFTYIIAHFVYTYNNNEINRTRCVCYQGVFHNIHCHCYPSISTVFLDNCCKLRYAQLVITWWAFSLTQKII